MEPKEVQKESTKKTGKDFHKEPNQKRADRLFAASADEETILKEFTKSYKARGKTDKEWVAKRAAIYMRIAEKNATKKNKK